VTGALVIGGLVGICVGAYGVLDETVPPILGLPMLSAGVAAALIGFTLGGRRLDRTAYRPDRWGVAETSVAATGVVAAVVMIVAGWVDPAVLQPSLVPLEWPTLAPVATLGILVAALPAWLAPPVRVIGDTTAGDAPQPAAVARRASGTQGGS
jgi:energy-coupling factor transport system permease protein